jgi:hypothetical protein
VNVAATSHEENVLKTKSDDVGLEYRRSLVDTSKLDKVKWISSSSSKIVYYYFFALLYMFYLKIYITKSNY